MKRKVIYGQSNYKDIITDEQYLYVDKTKFIQKLENLSEKHLIFLRPRRFGKSLFVSTLRYYYDERFKDEFNELFSKTYIGENPTKEANSYRVLVLEFSGINVIDRSIVEIKRDFVRKIKLNAQEYLQSYNYSKDEIDRLNHIDKIKTIADLKSYVLLGSKDGVEVVEVNICD